jgi:hypothetical protein
MPRRVLERGEPWRWGCQDTRAARQNLGMPDLIPVIDASQRLVLETLYRVFRETRAWPLYQYVASVLDDHDLDLQRVLESMPLGLYWPRHMGAGVVWYSDDQALGLRVRGLACCRRSETDIACLLAAVRFVVRRWREEKPRSPQTVVEPRLQFADFIEPVEFVVGLNPELYRVMLVLELMRAEPFLPSWEGSPDDPLQRHVRLSRDVLRFRNVETLNDLVAALLEEHPAAAEIRETRQEVGETSEFPTEPPLPTEERQAMVQPDPGPSAAAATPEEEGASEAEPRATPPLSVPNGAAARPEKREAFWDKWVRPILLTLISAGLLALIGWLIATWRSNGGGKATLSVSAETDPDRIVSGGRRLGAFYVIPRRVGAIPPPPFETDHCVGRYMWARRLGGVEVDMPLQFTVTASGGDVTIRGFRVDIERKGPPVRGSEIECRGRGQGGAERRMILVDLWRTRPASWQLAPTPADPSPTFVIPLEQERQIVFDVVARSHGCLCRWRAAFTYSVGNGPRRTVSLPAKNAPAFATTSAGRAERYHWNGRRWQFLGHGLP